MKRQKKKRDLLDRCARGLGAHPYPLLWHPFTCGEIGLVIAFEPAGPDTHNVDFDPVRREWDEGLYPNPHIGAFFLAQDGTLYPVGEDEFQLKLRIRSPRELRNVLLFYRNAKTHLSGGSARMRAIREMIETRAVEPRRGDAAHCTARHDKKGDET